jgi:hypothetical protein
MVGLDAAVVLEWMAGTRVRVTGRLGSACVRLEEKRVGEERQDGQFDADITCSF